MVTITVGDETVSAETLADANKLARKAARRQSAEYRAAEDRRKRANLLAADNMVLLLNGVSAVKRGGQRSWAIGEPGAANEYDRRAYHSRVFDKTTYGGVTGSAYPTFDVVLAQGNAGRLTFCAKVDCLIESGNGYPIAIRVVDSDRTYWVSVAIDHETDTAGYVTVPDCVTGMVEDFVAACRMRHETAAAQ